VANFTVTAPDTVYLYVNETTQFRVDIHNIGYLTLNDVILSNLPSNASVNVVPPYYDSIFTGEERAFLVSAVPEYAFNETVRFVLQTNETEPYYFDIGFLVSPAPPVFNTSTLLYRLNLMKDTFNDTLDVITMLNTLGYETGFFSQMLYTINQNMSAVQNEIMTGNYEQAYSLLQGLFEDIEDVYLSMQYLSPKEVSLPPIVIYIISLELAASVVILALLLIARRPLIIRLAIVLAIVNVAAVTLFFYLIQQISPFYYVVGLVVGSTVFIMARGALGIQRRFFKGEETYRIFLFTVMYFTLMTGALLGVISASNLVADALQLPLIPPTQGFPGEAYTVPVVTFSRNLEKVSLSAGIVSGHKVPPNTIFNMTIGMDSSVQLDGILMDYFPNSFDVVHSNGGVIESYNTLYNSISWYATSPGEVTYQLRSPNIEGRYYFGKALFNGSYERSTYHVDVVNTSQHISASYPDLGDLDGSTVTVSYLESVKIDDWTPDIGYDSDVVEAEIFLEVPWVSLDGAPIKVNMLEPYQQEVCTLFVNRPDSYSCEIELQKSGDIAELVIELYATEGTARLDYVYLFVTLLEPPEIVITDLEPYPDEVEIGEKVSYISLKIENNGESTAEDVNVELTLGDQVSQAFSCGNMVSGSTCPVVFDNNGNGFDVEQEDYQLISNISWQYGSVIVTRPAFKIVDTGSGVFGITSPSIIRHSNTSVYTVTFNNKWSKALTGINLSILCPGLECYCAEPVDFGMPYCSSANITAKGKKDVSFIIYAPEYIDELEYNISADVSYTNPNSRKNTIQNSAKAKLTVNSTYFWKNLVFDFSGNRKNFKPSHAPGFSVLFKEPLGPAEVPDNLNVVLLDPDGNEMQTGYDFELNPDGSINISMMQTRAFRPGRYRLLLSATEAGFDYTTDYNFTWGLVSVNTERSIYKPTSNATIIIVVLNSKGHLVQNANLTVVVTDPLGETTTFHRDPDNDVGTGIYAGIRGIYTVYYNTTVEGRYNVTAVSYLDEPVEFETYFMVLSDYDYDIVRHVPATIDPNIVNMTSEIEVVSLKSTELFDIVEYVPGDFDVFNTDAEINNSELTWHNMANNSVVSYEAIVPTKSPMLYILGPAEVNGFTEARPWYLAIDPFEEQLGADASGYLSSACTPTEGTLTNTASDDSNYFTQGPFDWDGASLAWSTENGYIDVQVTSDEADIQELHITWDGQGSKTSGKGATVAVAYYDWGNTQWVQIGATFGQSEVTRSVTLTTSTDIDNAIDDATGYVRVGMSGYGNNKNCADSVDHDFINITAVLPGCPIIDGDPATDSCGGTAGSHEWNYTDSSGSCPDNKWLIDDPASDAGSDNDDIDDVWSQDDDTYFSLMIKTAGTTPDNNLRIYFDPDEDGSYECYAYTSDGSTVTFSGGAGCGTTGSEYSDAGANGYAEYKVDINYICAAATDCCSSGADGCTGTSGSTRIYVEDPDASNDRAPDSGYYDHDFSSTCDGPSNPIPEFPIGAIIALLLPLILLGLFRSRRSI
jgi:hypothetical protein